MSDRTFIPDELFNTFLLPSEYIKEPQDFLRRFSRHQIYWACHAPKAAENYLSLINGKYHKDGTWQTHHMELVRKLNSEL